MVSGRIQYVQLVNVPLDAVHFPVKVLDSRRVLLVESPVQESGHDCTFANFGGSKNHHPVAVLCWDVKIAFGGRHFFDHV